MSVGLGYSRLTPLLLILLHWVAGSISRANEIVISSRSYEPSLEKKSKYPGSSTSYRIIDGEESSIGQFPSFVRVVVEVSREGDVVRTAQCGGTILSPVHVISAAHCFQYHTINSIKVYPGRVNDNRDQFYYVHHVCISERFRNGRPDRNGFLTEKITNDVAILHLESPISFNRFVRPATLPNRQLFGSGVVIGMGDNNVTLVSPTLQYTRARVVSCEWWIRHPSIMCIRRVDATDGRVCKGDSGGAFYIRDGNRLKPVGGVSFTSSTCEADDSTVSLANYYTLLPIIDNLMHNCEGPQLAYRMQDQ